MKILFTFIILTLGFSSAMAQSALFKGKVKDSEQRPIPFATIAVLGSADGVNADQKGNYQISLPAGTYQVEVSAVGFEKMMQTVTLATGEGSSVDFELKQSEQLAEVIVSASRKQEFLDEVPSSITIIGAKELAVQKAVNNNLSDILANSVPGMGFNTNRSSNLGQTMRGRGILVMIDGVPQSTPLRNGARDIRALDPVAVERVEIIKGATAIYGNGADGGLINYITKKPSTGKVISGQTNAGASAFLVSPANTFGGSLGQLLSGSAGKFDYVVSGRYEQTGVSRDAKGRVLSPEYGLNDLKMWNAFAKIGYNVNAKNRVEVMYNYFSSKQHTDYVVKAGVYGNVNEPTTDVPGNRPGKPEGTPYNHNVNLHYLSQGIIGQTDLDVNLYMQDFYTLLSSNNFFEGNGQPGIVGKKKGLRINFNTPLTASENINGNLVYGVDLLSDKTSTVLTDGRVSVPEMDMRNLAPYMQLKSVFFQNLILKAGARFENININVPTYSTLATLNYSTGKYTGGGTIVKGGSLNYNALVFNAGVRYNKLALFKPFLSFSQSFSIGDLGLVLRAASENTLADLTTRAVKVNNYEFGFNTTLGKLNLEAAVYVSTSKLGASYVFIDGKAQIARSPENVRGLEFSADYTVSRAVSLGGSYSLTEGKRTVNGSKVYLGGDRISPAKTTAFVSVNILPKWQVRL
ncbi:TonB-dependent receptor [Dyadobacter sp. 50-39]|uniref:TonB-dependent receptor n=1 Tax=Dyadobacter sp. 50-39 TaxID=1895756 RepID=UPI000ACC9102|nr:TonB-dependent receptor [Dyadobacter sp. 50-39]